MLGTNLSQAPTHQHNSTSACDGRSSANHHMIKFNRKRRSNFKMFLPLVLCLYIISNSLTTINLSNASPVPEPSPARTKHSAHRLPPINGSIFGKRSLNAMVNTLDSNSSDKLLKLEERLLKKYQTNRQQDKTHPPNYHDIITELIEDFMALNNESDPEEASASFCRMIVYECQQMLGSINRSPVHRNNKKYRR